MDLFPYLDTALLWTFYVFLMASSVFFFFVAMTTIWWQTHAWRTPEAHRATGYPTPDEPKLSFSLIIPCREESESVMRATLVRLLHQTHPRVQVVFSLAEDDPETIAIANRLAAEDPRVSVSITGMEVEGQGKPRQLNVALLQCTGDIVGIFDAESLAAPDLLTHIDSVFRQENADVVQGSVQLINHSHSFVSLRSVMEYYFYFRSRLHAQALQGFIPLGGNTVFMRRELLIEVGGWDPHCLAEDCDLGVRMSTLGHKTSVVFDPALTTLEEAPITGRSWVKQRTRWNLGFLQVYKKGDWRALPTSRERALARWTLMQPFMMAIAGIMIPVALLTALVLSPPMWVTFILFLPMFPTLLIVAMENAALRDYGKDFGFKIGPIDHLRLTLSMPFYQMMAGFAAIRAYYKYLRKDFAWDKTMHSGEHLTILGEGVVDQPMAVQVNPGGSA